MIVSNITTKLSGDVRSNVESDGGHVRDGESFSVFYAPGGLTGLTTWTLGGEACTSVVIVDDFNGTAVGPVDNLRSGVSYTLSIL